MVAKLQRLKQKEISMKELVEKIKNARKAIEAKDYQTAWNELYLTDEQENSAGVVNLSNVVRAQNPDTTKDEGTCPRCGRDHNGDCHV
jgi:Mg/Co/Ni transporter MgtE